MTDPVLIIIVITCGISILAFYDRNVMGRLVNSPYNIKHFNQWYRLLTSGFLHADFMHLLINMYVFYSFGGAVLYYYQQIFDIKGVWYFIVLYLGAILISDLPTYKKHQDDPHYASLGASGGVSAVLFAFIFLDPSRKLMLMFLPVALPGILFGVAYLAYSYYMSKRGRDYINHSAHFTGAVFGIVYTILLRPSLVIDFIQQIKSLF